MGILKEKNEDLNRLPLFIGLFHKCGSRGGQGVRIPPGKSQVIWVSIGNKQLDHPPRKIWPPEKFGTLKMIDFFEIDHLISVK